MIKNLPLLIIIILNYINIKKYFIFPYIIVFYTSTIIKSWDSSIYAKMR